MDHSISFVQVDNPVIVGKHAISDMYNCSVDLSVLEDIEQIRDHLREACKRAGATIESEHLHKFNPVGISGVFVLSESHISIHIWANERYISVDCYTCGDYTEPQKAIDYLIEVFNPERVNNHYLDRSLRGSDLEKPVNGILTTTTIETKEWVTVNLSDQRKGN